MRELRASAGRDAVLAAARTNSTRDTEARARLAHVELLLKHQTAQAEAGAAAAAERISMLEASRVDAEGQLRGERTRRKEARLAADDAVQGQADAETRLVQELAQITAERARLGLC